MMNQMTKFKPMIFILFFILLNQILFSGEVCDCSGYECDVPTDRCYTSCCESGPPPPPQTGTLTITEPTSSTLYSTVVGVSTSLANAKAYKIKIIMTGPSYNQILECNGINITSCYQSFSGFGVGTYSISAFAYDNLNRLIGTATPKSIIIKTGVRISSPVSGSTLYQKNLEVTAMLIGPYSSTAPITISASPDPDFVFTCNSGASCTHTFEDVDYLTYQVNATAPGFDNSIVVQGPVSVTMACTPYTDLTCYVSCASDSTCTSLPGGSDLKCKFFYNDTRDEDGGGSQCVKIKIDGNGDGTTEDGYCVIPGCTTCPQGYTCETENYCQTEISSDGSYCSSGIASQTCNEDINPFCNEDNGEEGNCDSPGCNSPQIPGTQQPFTTEASYSIGNFYNLTPNPEEMIIGFAIPIILISAISIAYSTVLYMFFKTFSDQRQTAEYKNELKSILLNVVLLVVIVLIFKASNTMFGGNLVELAQQQLVKLMEYPARAFRTTTSIAGEISTLSSISTSGSISFWLIGIGYNYSTNAGSYARERIGTILSNSFLHLVALRGLGVLVSIFTFLSIKFMIPIGIILRALPHTRRLGSTMVAIGFGVSLALPLSIYLMGSIADTFMSSPNIFDVSNNLDKAAKAAGSIDSILNNLIKPLYWTGQISGILKGISTVLVIADAIAVSNVPIIGQIAATVFSWVVFGTKLASLILATAVRISVHGMMVDLASDKYGFFEYMTDALLGINLALTLFYFVVSMMTLSLIRGLSSIIGGEFFLYGVENLI